MINWIQVSDFDIREKKEIIQHIKETNKDIKKVQGIDIKWIEQHNILKARQELASLVIEFSTPIYTNVALDYNIVLSQKVFGVVVFNRACKWL